MTTDLTQDQRIALAWVRDFPCTSSEWRSGAKAARGAPSNWDRIRLSGPKGMIEVLNGDWEALRAHLKPADFGTARRIYDLTDTGHAALAKSLNTSSEKDA